MIKSRSSLLAPAQPGGPGKRAVKWLWYHCEDPVQRVVTNTRKYDRGLHHAMRHEHWLDMTDRIVFQIAVTVFMAWLQTPCLICVLIQRHTAHYLDTVSDPSTETTLLSAVPPVKLSMHGG